MEAEPETVDDEEKLERLETAREALAGLAGWDKGSEQMLDSTVGYIELLKGDLSE